MEGLEEREKRQFLIYAEEVARLFKAERAKEGQLRRALKLLRWTYKQTVAALAEAIDARDPYTYGHSERVARIARRLAEALGLDDPFLEMIEVAALLHDVGKIGVEDAVLKKPGRLSQEEFEKVKIHPILSAKIVSQVEALYPQVPIVRHHHERFDGSGYPDGLSGKDIPLGARIVAVADTWDAITSDRAYRRAMDFERALREMKRASGSQHDPGVVEALFWLVENDPEVLKA